MATINKSRAAELLTLYETQHDVSPELFGQLVEAASRWNDGPTARRQAQAAINALPDGPALQAWTNRGRKSRRVGR